MPIDWPFRVNRAIESVRNQRVKADEIIVIDDASDEGDETFLVVQQYDGEPGTPVGYERTEFGNVALARNKGISMSDSRYVVSLDGDDEIGPDWIGDCLARLG